MNNTYAIFSNHFMIEPQTIEMLMSTLKDEKIDGIILNGDFTRDETHDTDDDVARVIYQNYTEKLFEAYAKTNLEVYVNPGTLDEKTEYYDILNNLKSKYPNIIDTTKEKIITRKGYELMFLPGNIENPDICEDDFSYTLDELQDLTHKIKNPEKTIMFASTPPLFKTPNGVDFMRLWKLQNDAKMIDPATNKEYLQEAGTIIYDEEIYFLEKTAIVKEIYSNGGHEMLTTICKNKGLDKLMINFFDGNSKFHDWDERRVKPKTYTNELICVPSLTDQFIFSIINLKEDKIAYNQFIFNNIPNMN